MMSRLQAAAGARTAISFRNGSLYARHRTVLGVTWTVPVHVHRPGGEGGRPTRARLSKRALPAIRRCFPRRNQSSTVLGYHLTISGAVRPRTNHTPIFQLRKVSIAPDGDLRARLPACAVPQALAYRTHRSALHALRVKVRQVLLGAAFAHGFACRGCGTGRCAPGSAVRVCCVRCIRGDWARVVQKGVLRAGHRRQRSPFPSARRPPYSAESEAQAHD